MLSRYNDQIQGKSLNQKIMYFYFLRIFSHLVKTSQGLCIFNDKDAIISA